MVRIHGLRSRRKHSALFVHRRVLHPQFQLTSSFTPAAIVRTVHHASPQHLTVQPPFNLVQPNRITAPPTVQRVRRVRRFVHTGDKTVAHRRRTQHYIGRRWPGSRGTRSHARDTRDTGDTGENVHPRAAVQRLPNNVLAAVKRAFGTFVVAQTFLLDAQIVQRQRQTSAATTTHNQGKRSERQWISGNTRSNNSNNNNKEQQQQQRTPLALSSTDVEP